MASAGITLHTGRKWRAQEGLEIAESRLRHRALVGTVAMTRADTGEDSGAEFRNVSGLMS